MKKRDLLATALAVLAGFIAANLAMLALSRRLLPSRILDEISNTRHADVIVVGNSLLQGVFDPATFGREARRQSQHWVAVNTALGATFSAEHYLLFEQALRIPGIHTVILGFYDLQLSAPTDPEVSALLDTRVLAFDPRIPARDAESIYGFPLEERLRFRVFRALPLLAFRSVGWESVERLRIGLGAPRWNVDVGIAEQYRNHARYLAGSPVHFNTATEKMVREARARRLRFVFVLMPMSPFHIRTIYSQPGWKSYLASLRTLMEREGCLLIDATIWFPSQSDFVDSIHLAYGNRELFSTKLAAAVIALPNSGHTTLHSP